MTIRTIDHSDQWNDFRTNDPSDYRPVGLLTIRTSARFSDQWTVGPTTIRNIELSPICGAGLAGSLQGRHWTAPLYPHPHCALIRALPLRRDTPRGGLSNRLRQQAWVSCIPLFYSTTKLEHRNSLLCDTIKKLSKNSKLIIFRGNSLSLKTACRINLTMYIHCL